MTVGAPRYPRNPERSFGVSVGLVLIVIAAALWWRGHHVRAESVAAVGAVLVTAGLLVPALLWYPSRLWFRFAHALGYVNARVLLTLLFGVVLVPLAVLWRITGTDPLARRRGTWAGWQPYPVRYRDRKHYERMY
jgi:Saxitoxin biosynthesis operon protein SxtJ